MLKKTVIIVLICLNLTFTTVFAASMKSPQLSPESVLCVRFQNHQDWIDAYRTVSADLSLCETANAVLGQWGRGLWGNNPDGITLVTAEVLESLQDEGYDCQVCSDFEFVETLDGESLGRMASRYGYSLRYLAEVNGIPAGRLAGDMTRGLIIPIGEVSYEDLFEEIPSPTPEPTPKPTERPMPVEPAGIRRYDSYWPFGNLPEGNIPFEGYISKEGFLPFRVRGVVVSFDYKSGLMRVVSESDIRGEPFHSDVWYRVTDETKALRFKDQDDNTGYCYFDVVGDRGNISGKPEGRIYELVFYFPWDQPVSLEEKVAWVKETYFNTHPEDPIRQSQPGSRKNPLEVAGVSLGNFG
ncbi:MAG: hypothetical protein ABIK79_08655 [Chloroflexota bacterium]